MNVIERRKFDLLQRVKTFGEARTADFPTDSSTGKLFTELNRIVTDLINSGAGQLSATGINRASATAKNTTRDFLRVEMAAISRTAKLLGGQIPGISEKFRLPRNNADQTLLLAAKAFAKDLIPVQDLFLAHELPPGFLADLNGAIAAFEDELRKRAAASMDSVAANKVIQEGISRGMATVRRLDVLVRNKYRADPVTLAAWASASHLERASRQASPKAANAPAA